MKSLLYIATIINCATIVHLTWRWTKSTVPEKSKLMIAIEKLPRLLNVAADARRAEGIKRERWVLMFGSMDQYTTTWREVNGYDYLYAEDTGLMSESVLGSREKIRNSNRDSQIASREKLLSNYKEDELEGEGIAMIGNSHRRSTSNENSHTK